MNNIIYGQGDNANIHPGVVPYVPPMVPLGAGGDSLFQIAWRGKWFILVSAVLGLGGAFLYLRTMGTEYMAMSRVLVEKPRLTQAMDITLPGDTAVNYLQQQASIITSRERRNEALRDPNLFMISALSDPNRMQAVLRSLSARVGKDDIISVTASSDDPNGAAAIVNAFVSAYVKWRRANKQDSTDNLYDGLSEKLKVIAKDLEGKHRRLADFGKPIGFLDNSQRSADSQTLDRYEQELIAANLHAIQQRTHYDRLVSLEADPNRFRQYVLSQGLAAENRERIRLAEVLERTRMQLEELLAVGTVQKSQVTLLENREKECVRKIEEYDAKFVREQLAFAKDLADDADRRVKGLAKLCEDEAKELQRANAEDSLYEIAKRQYQMANDLYNSVLAKMNSIDVNRQLDAVSIHILEKAVAGVEAPSQTARVMGVGLVLGLMLGGGLAFLRDWRDPRVRSADEITAILGVPILGAVPTIPRRGLIRRGPRSRLASHTREFEAYRSIRTALFFGAVREEAKTLLVTSPGPLEGKTTLVSNLGIAMARAGQKTLIVDADLRKPTQHRVFAKKGHTKGLVDVLTGTATLDEAIRPTEVPGLDVLECGTIVANPSELLGSDLFWAVFEQLKGRYDRVLVDSPPVGVVADAQILAARCGLTLLVLRAQKSSRLITQRARDALLTVSARVVGAVVNDVRKGDSRYSHYGYGAYNYYHHNGHDGDGRRAARKELPSAAGPQADDGPPVDKQQ
ncbi:MAG TPA: polysaccharide biosynthesis tyrosine autokinase [Sedimentisphaerales bacterium]|jgi:capsular exopolysaccharide synthesis family protein|nr:polysaccharide biosynthesis tyrosine autokinase [Sedimentisphaerales bacterium]HNU29654.1 polysaccharide biosynthesis tyrosine autokinase [Sedimentisphaerales bacterium]